MLYIVIVYYYIFFFIDTGTTEIYTLSLHDALPICDHGNVLHRRVGAGVVLSAAVHADAGDADHVIGPDRSTALLSLPRDRKSTRLNSSHANISYAVFCLKKKN